MSTVAAVGQAPEPTSSGARHELAHVEDAEALDVVNGGGRTSADKPEFALNTVRDEPAVDGAGVVFMAPMRRAGSQAEEVLVIHRKHGFWHGVPLDAQKLRVELQLTPFWSADDVVELRVEGFEHVSDDARHSGWGHVPLPTQVGLAQRRVHPPEREEDLVLSVQLSNIEVRRDGCRQSAGFLCSRR